MADLHGHVGIPKCLQLEFSTKEQIQVFDIERNRAYTSNCDRAGTENHYYTEKVEKLLSDRVEDKMAKLIKELRECEKNYDFTNCLNRHRDVLESFFKFQLQRSKKMLSSINEKSIYARTFKKFSHSSLLETIDNTETNILTVLGGSLFALRIVCDENQYLLTNSLGFYFIIDGKRIKYFIIPLSNKDAICIQSGFDKEKPFSHYTLTREICDYFNKSCYRSELQLGNGYLYSKEKKELEDFFCKEKLEPHIVWNDLFLSKTK